MAQAEDRGRRETDGGDAAAGAMEFSPAERRRLARLRRLIKRGERSERYPIDKRQAFARWLIEHKRLSDE